MVIVVGVPRSELEGSGSLSLGQNHVTYGWCCNLVVVLQYNRFF